MAAGYQHSTHTNTHGQCTTPRATQSPSRTHDTIPYPCQRSLAESSNVGVNFFQGNVLQHIHRRFPTARNGAVQGLTYLGRAPSCRTGGSAFAFLSAVASLDDRCSSSSEFRPLTAKYVVSPYLSYTALSLSYGCLCMLTHESVQVFADPLYWMRVILASDREAKDHRMYPTYSASELVGLAPASCCAHFDFPRERIADASCSLRSRPRPRSGDGLRAHQC